MADVHAFLMPTSVAARDELLDDEKRLRALCEEYYLRFVGAQRSSIGVRVVGLVVSGIHRELCLPVPGDKVLYRAMMEHVCGNGFELDHLAFVAFIEKVICQCIRGTPLGEEQQPPSPSGSFADEDGETVELPQSTSFGMITVHAQKLDGTSASISVNEADGIATLQQGVQEQLGVPKALQRLVFDSCTLDLNRPLCEQGVLDGAAITVVRCRPQATLLRIRREKPRYTPATETVPSVEGDVGLVMPKPEIQPEAKHVLTLSRRAHRSKSSTKPSSNHIDLDPLSFKKDRCSPSDVRIRKVNIGRL